jgi:hypothetical protein
MSQEIGSKNEQRLNIPFFEGVNSLIGSNIAKKTELAHAENCRSQVIGVLEKRMGQTVLGTDINGNTFITSANYGLFSFQDGAGQGFYRISETIDPSSPSASISPSASVSPSASASPSASTSQSPSSSASPSASVSPSSSSSASLSPSASVSPSASTSQSPSASYSPSASSSPSSSVSPSPQAEFATIYYLDNNNKWTPLAGRGTSIDGATFDYTYAENSAFLVNYDDKNRYIQADGVTVVDSTSGGGHLFNTPNASRINFYKDRLYLADYVTQGERYKTTVLRSSFPMGIIALVNADYDATISTTVKVTDSKYFYTDSGANSYDIYRGTTKITTITVTAINETDVTVTGTITGILASDEIWIAGTYNGPKVFRWINNPTTSGQDVQQYDTFKLSGGENDPITMMTNIGNVMLISNKSAMASWNDYTLQNFDLDIGCVSKKGYTKILGTLYFLHYTGVYATSGDVPRLMSNKVEKYITGATKTGKEQCAAGKKGRNIFFTLGDVTLYNPDGSVDRVLSDVCIEYNLTQENWFVHTNVKASEFATFVEASDSDRLEFTDTSGNFAVKEFLSGSTDDGVEIPFRIDTNFLTMQPTKIEATSKPIALIVESERGAGIQAYVNLGDKGGYYPLEGNVRKGLSVLKINNKDEGRSKPPTARVISVSLRDASKQLCKISRMSIVHLPTNEEVANNQ